MSEKEDTYRGLVEAVIKGDGAAKDALHDWLIENGMPKPLPASEAKRMTRDKINTDTDALVAYVSFLITEAAKNGKNAVDYSIKDIPYDTRSVFYDKLGKLGYDWDWADNKYNSIRISW